ncbi:MAG: AraC family transcriptional regulator [Bacteroidota bacterium]
MILLKNKYRRKINEIFSEIVDEYKRTELLKFQKISSLLNVLYITLSRIYLPDKIIQSKNFNYLGRLKQFDQLIEKHFMEYKYPKDYALLMHMSEKHLNRICKTCLNKTTSELIIERIVLEAKRRLAFAGNSVSQIADELGYSNSSYFIRFFKKKTGKTPVEFMHEFRETTE